MMTAFRVTAFSLVLAAAPSPALGDWLQNAGGAISGGAKKIGDEVSQGAKDAAGDVTTTVSDATDHIATVVTDGAGHVTTVIKDQSGNALSPVRDVFGNQVINRFSAQTNYMWTFVLDQSGNIVSTVKNPYGQWAQNIATGNVPGVQVVDVALVGDWQHVRSQVRCALKDASTLAVAVGDHVKLVAVHAGESIFETAQRAFYSAELLVSNDWHQFKIVIIKIADVQVKIATLGQTLAVMQKDAASIPQIHAPAYLVRAASRLGAGIPASIDLPKDADINAVAALHMPSPTDLFGEAGAALGQSGSALVAEGAITFLPVEDVGTFLGDEFAKSKSGIASLNASPSVIVSNLSTYLFKKITDTHNRYTDSLRAFLKPLRGHAPQAAYVIEDPTNLIRNNVCAARSLERLNQYLADTKSIGIVDWPSKIAEIQLDALAGAEQLLTKNAIALAAAQIEIKANGCDNIGIDRVIGESLLDASEWLAWVKEVRGNLASNAAK